MNMAKTKKKGNKITITKYRNGTNGKQKRTILFSRFSVITNVLTNSFEVLNDITLNIHTC